MDTGQEDLSGKNFCFLLQPVVFKREREKEKKKEIYKNKTNQQQNSNKTKFKQSNSFHSNPAGLRESMH